MIFADDDETRDIDRNRQCECSLLRTRMMLFVLGKYCSRKMLGTRDECIYVHS